MTDELSSAIRALEGTRVSEVRRTLNIAIVGFARGDEDVRLHSQCPLRIVYGDRVVLGSADMRYPVDRKADPADAFDRYETQYDRSAEQATTILSGRPYLVTTAALDPAGQIRLECTDGLRLEVFPDVAGPIECWRLFVKGSDNHHIYESGRRPRHLTD